MIAKPVFIIVLAWIGIAARADNSLVSACGELAPVPSFPGSANDELVKYKTYTREVLHPIWSAEMVKNQSSLWFGQVRIRCTVHSDGSVSDLSIPVGAGTGLLKTVSQKALLASAPFKPFDAALLKEVGTSYTDDFVFSVVSKPTRPDKDWAPSEQDTPPAPRD
jgi:hypothetical protein